MFSGPLTPERDLIYRIVEQWGNAIEMPNMEGWLKEYAQQAPINAVWVRATTRLPVAVHPPELIIVKRQTTGGNYMLRYMTANQLADMAKGDIVLQYEWLDESESPAPNPDELWDEFSEATDHGIVMSKEGWRKVWGRVGLK
jgi:hypothetical protein